MGKQAPIVVLSCGCGVLHRWPAGPDVLCCIGGLVPGVVNRVKSIRQHFLGCCSLFPDHQHGRVSALDFGFLSSSDSALRQGLQRSPHALSRCAASVSAPHQQSVSRPSSPLFLCSVCVRPGIFLCCSPSFLFEPGSLTKHRAH